MGDDAESALVRELRALAGVASGDELQVRHEGVVIHVSYTSGSSSRLVMRVAYDAVATGMPRGGYRGGGELAAMRPMRIALRPERESERQGKAGGIDVEVQTGDAAFDAAVYVDTPTRADVSIHVLGADVRRAVLELFAIEFTSITIDDPKGDVVAEIVSFTSLQPPSHPGRRAVEAFARLARGLPRVARASGVHASHPLGGCATAMGVVAFILFIAAFPIYFAGSVEGRCESPMNVGRCFGPGIAGLVIGLVVAVVVGLVAARFTRRYRGRSDSSRVGSSFTITAAMLAFLLVGSAVAFLIARM